MSSTIRTRLLRATALAVCSAVGASASAQGGPEPHVRSLSPRVASAIDLMQRRSPTFARLLMELDASDVIVHIVERQGPCEGGANSCLLMVGNRGGHRYLRAMIRSMQTYDAVITEVAHELEHAAEIAHRTDVRLNASICDGVVWHSTAGRCETRAAQVFARQVIAELEASR